MFALPSEYFLPFLAKKCAKLITPIPMLRYLSVLVRPANTGKSWYSNKASIARIEMSANSINSLNESIREILNAANVHNAISPFGSFMSFNGLVGNAISKHKLDIRVGALIESKGPCMFTLSTFMM